MNIKCILGFHSWDGCTCTKCGKKRDEAHRLTECKCEICGKVLHKWDGGCTCKVCGIVGNQKAHRWDGGCTCKVCGLVREKKGHKWDNGVCSICGKRTKHGGKQRAKHARKQTFMEWAEKACHSQQTILIDLKDANHLLTAVRKTLIKAQGLDDTISEVFHESHDRAKQVIRLDCPNCGEFSYQAKIAIYFSAEGGGAETLGTVIAGGPNTASALKMKCPGCQGTEIRAIFKIVINEEEEIQSTRDAILESIKTGKPIENILPEIHMKDCKILANAIMHLDCLSDSDKGRLFKNLDDHETYHILTHFDDSSVINLVQQLERGKRYEVIGSLRVNGRDHLDFRTLAEKQEAECEERKVAEKLKANQEYNALVEEMFANIQTKGYTCSNCQEADNFKLSTCGLPCDSEHFSMPLIICRKCGHVVDCEECRGHFSVGEN